MSYARVLFSWILLVLLFLGVVYGQAEPIIYSSITANSFSASLPQGSTQTFCVSSLYALDKLLIFFNPYSQSDSSFNVEISDTSSFLGSSSTLSLGPSFEYAWYSFPFNQHLDRESSKLLILKPDYIYELKLLGSRRTGFILLNHDVYADGHSDLSDSYDMVFQLFAISLQVAHWPFDGTYDDISSSKLGMAIPVGNNVTLLDYYLTIRSPGYLNVPRVDIHNRSFTVTFDLRILTSSAIEKQYLFADWSPKEWQFLSQIDVANTISIHLRRNIPKNGRNLDQELVHVTSSTSIPLGEWFNVAWAFDRPGRTLTLYATSDVTLTRV